MIPLFDDTSPEAEQQLLELLRHAPPWRRMEMHAQIWRTLRDLALCGLRQRFPQAGADELKRRLADLLIGPEQALLAYGPRGFESSPNAL